eukprot:6091650-Amphidinium_carterae.1
MLDVATLGRIDSSMRLIKDYDARYAGQWPRIYQVDCQCRGEFMERVRWDLEDEKARAVQAGRLHDYTPSRPWEHVFAVVVKDSSFWHRELEEPCQNLRIKGTLSDPDRVAPTVHPAATPKRNPQRERVHHVQDGHFVTNCQGVTLCKAWQE